MLSSSVEAVAKGQQIQAKLAVYQAPLGLASIGLAVMFAVFHV